MAYIRLDFLQIWVLIFGLFIVLIAFLFLYSYIIDKNLFCTGFLSGTPICSLTTGILYDVGAELGESCLNTNQCKFSSRNKNIICCNSTICIDKTSPEYTTDLGQGQSIIDFSKCKRKVGAPCSSDIQCEGSSVCCVGVCRNLQPGEFCNDFCENLRNQGIDCRIPERR